MTDRWRSLGTRLDLLNHELSGAADELILATMAQGYHLLGATDPDSPSWIPFLSPAVRSAATNPDTVYAFARIDGNGTYRICGTKGNSCFADVLAQSGIVGLADSPGPTVGVLDLEDVPTAADGSFEIVLSADKPTHDSAHWWPLDPRTDQLWLRQVAYDWETTIDASVAITRTDRPEPSSRESVDIERIGDFVETYTRAWRTHVLGLRDRGVVNSLEVVPLADETGQVAQSYYQGLFEIPEDSALLLEVSVPPCRYWNVQLTDENFVAVDWLRHQSSLNGAQAHLDADGVFRAVISRQDPGVANWLDPGAVASGTILGRWNRSKAHPAPTLRKVTLGELPTVLPADTRYVSADERAEALRRRSVAAQLRRHW